MQLVLGKIRGRPPGGNCVIVTHEDVMWAIRFLLEGLTQDEWRELLLSDDPCTKLRNGQVLHYSRRDPQTGQCSDTFGWVRSVCPWDPRRSNDDWRKVESARVSNQRLLATVERIPRLIHGPPATPTPVPYAFEWGERVRMRDGRDRQG